MYGSHLYGFDLSYRSGFAAVLLLKNACVGVLFTLKLYNVYQCPFYTKRALGIQYRGNACFTSVAHTGIERDRIPQGLKSVYKTFCGEYQGRRIGKGATGRLPEKMSIHAAVLPYDSRSSSVPAGTYQPEKARHRIIRGLHRIDHRTCEFHSSL